MPDLLVGRSAQLETIIRILASTRLLTITGTMGIGKTFFAERLCSKIPYSVSAIISFGIPDQVAVKAEGAEAFYIKPSEVLDMLDMLDAPEVDFHKSLFVLDGCESQLEAVVAVAESALIRFPDMRIVATSQVPLHLPGEICFELPPLSLPSSTVPSPEELGRSEAGALFVSSAIEADPTLVLDGWTTSTIAQICHLLRGIPLPIKVAAAQTSNMPVSEIASRLIESAYLAQGGREDTGVMPAGLHSSKPDGSKWPVMAADLIPDHYRTLLAATGVCAGGATPDILGIIDDTCSRDRITNDLAYLASMSLVSASSAGGKYRYYLVEPLRQRLDALLPACPSKHAHRMHPESLNGLYGKFTKWCIEYVAGAEESLISGHAQQYWLERLDGERLNIYGAIRCALDSSDIEAACRIGAEIWRYWELRNKLEEGKQFLQQIVDAGSFEHVEPELKLRIYDGLGMIYWRRGDCDAATAYFNNALDCIGKNRRVPDRYQSRLFNHAGLALAFSGNSDQALEMFYMAADRSRQCNNHAEAALALANTGLVYAEHGRIDDARKVLLEALGTEGIEGDEHGLAITRLHLGIVDLLEEKHAKAREHFCRAAEKLVAVGDERSAAFAVSGYAVSYVTIGAKQALMLAGAADATSMYLGTPAPQYWRSRISEALSPAFANLEEAALEAWTEGQRMTLPSAVRIMRSLEGKDSIAGVKARDAAASPPGISETQHEERPQSAYIKLFGGFSLTAADGQVVINGKPKKALAALAACGGSIHVEQLMEILWPYADPQVAKQRLRNVLLRLRQCAGSIVTRYDEEIKLHQGVQADVLQFMDLARRSMATVVNGLASDEEAAVRAIRLYSGDLLPEYAYDDWAISARERMKRLYVTMLNMLARKACETGSPAATGWLEALIAADPYDDASYLLLAELHYNEGRYLAALDTIRRARSVATDLETAPSARLLRLEERIRSEYL